MNWLRRVYYNFYYYFHPPWDTGISPPELFAYMENHSPGRALDLGCGTGTNAITLTQHGWEVTGIDFAIRAIRIARQKAQEAGLIVDFRAGDVTKLERFSGQFDLVLDIGCFHSLKPEVQVAYIHNLERLLVTGGNFLVYGFISESSSNGPGIPESTLNEFEDSFVLIGREDGVNRFQRPSVWLTYQRKLIGNQGVSNERMNL